MTVTFKIEEAVSESVGQDEILIKKEKLSKRKANIMLGMLFC